MAVLVWDENKRISFHILFFYYSIAVHMPDQECYAIPFCIIIAGWCYQTLLFVVVVVVVAANKEKHTNRNLESDEATNKMLLTNCASSKLLK